jgi:AcrR family transcriptional regulator
MNIQSIMPSSMQPFEDEPASTREAIMQATYVALAEHGYADLTIQRISDEFDKSKSLLYHHYESKDALLVDFMGFMLEQITADLPLAEQPNAYETFMVGIHYIFEDMLAPERSDFVSALLELRAQATHNDTYREQINANERFLQDRFAEIIESGIEEGTFRDVDPHRTAQFVLSVLDGAVLRSTTVDDADLDAIQDELDEYFRSRVLADDFDPEG